MANLINLFHQNNLKSFDEIKSFVSQPPYFLEVREDKPVSNLYLLVPTENSDIHNKVVRECNGIILDKNTNQVVSYGLDRVFLISEIEDSGIDWDSLNYNKCIDGTLIRVYYYNAKWNVSTTKCINSKKSRWSSNKSFYDLFMDCGLDFESLDKNNCYCYILQHPETRLVVPHILPLATLVGIRNMNTFELTFFSIPALIPENNKLEFIKNQSFTNGSFLTEYNGMTIRIDSDEFEKVRNLRANVPDIKMKYIEYYNDQDKKDDLVKYFPECIPVFKQVELDIQIHASRIQDLYYKFYVKKQKTLTIPFKYERTLNQLHGQFKKTKVVTTKAIVVEKLISLPFEILYWILYQ